MADSKSINLLEWSSDEDLKSKISQYILSKSMMKVGTNRLEIFSSSLVSYWKHIKNTFKNCRIIYKGTIAMSGFDWAYVTPTMTVTVIDTASCHTKIQFTFDTTYGGRFVASMGLNNNWTRNIMRDDDDHPCLDPEYAKNLRFVGDEGMMAKISTFGGESVWKKD